MITPAVGVDRCVRPKNANTQYTPSATSLLVPLAPRGTVSYFLSPSPFGYSLLVEEGEFLDYPHCAYSNLAMLVVKSQVNLALTRLHKFSVFPFPLSVYRFNHTLCAKASFAFHSFTQVFTLQFFRISSLPSGCPRHSRGNANRGVQPLPAAHPCPRCRSR